MTIIQDHKQGPSDPQQLRAVLDQMETCVYTKDLSRRYTYVNDLVCKLLGRPREDLLGRRAEDLFNTDDARRLHQHDDTVLEQGRSVTCEEVLSIDEGQTRHFWSIKQPLRDAQGRIAGLSGVSTDITARKRQEEQLIAVKNHLAATLQAMPDLVFEVDLNGRYHHYHSPLQHLLARPPEQLLGKTVHEVLPPEAATLCMRALNEALHQGRSGGQQFALPLPGGQRWFELSVSRKAGDTEGLPRFIVISRDITDRREAEQTLRSHESLLRAIVDNTPVEYWARDLEGRCIMENALVVERWGSLLGKRLEDTHTRPEDVARWQANNRRAYAGEVVDEEIQYLVGAERRTFQNVVAPVRRDGQIVGIVGFNQDITERKAAADQIRSLAFYDALTRLPNRRLMFDRLGQALVNSARQRRAGALLLIDLDHFKVLNDTQGHDAGDRLLLEVAARLTTGLRPGDTAARLGGDEFVVIVEALDDQVDATRQAELIAQQLQARLGEPCLLQLPSQHRVLSHHFTNSIGITVFEGTDVSAEELLRRADTAMYQAKAAGRNTLRFYDPQLQAQVEARAELAADLRRALEDDQFLLYYQPQVDANGRIVGAEALLRWQHPLRGMVSPAEFIPLAEETGLIVPLGHQVLESACRQLALWARHPATAKLSLAVNVSAHQFRQPAFVAQLRELLTHFDAPPSRLKLELTESLLLDNTDDTITRMQSLKQLGVGFSLDDFGTGSSSLAYLKRLPLDQLKIDQSFVRDVLTDANDAAIARTIVALGNTLGLAVIAEGVETEAQHRFLADNGCHAYQGYLFSRPLPLAGFEALLSNESTVARQALTPLAVPPTRSVGAVAR